MSEREFEESTQLLRELVKIRSENPASNEVEIANFVKNFLDENRIENRIIEFDKNRPSVVGLIEGTQKKNIAFVGHLDTVNTDPKKWKYDPFSATLEDGKLYGLGASDMKSGVASILYLSKLLKKNNIHSIYSFLFAFTADEENLYRGAEKLAKSGVFDDTEFIIVTEPTNLKVFIREKGELWIRIELFGKQAHGSTPKEGINTIEGANFFLSNLLRETKRLFKGKFPHKSTLNIGKINGGVQANIVPDYTAIELDFRLYETPEETILSLISNLLNETNKRFNTKSNFDVFNYHKEIKTVQSNPYVKRLLEITKTKPGTATYCTDLATILDYKYIPFAIFGPGKIELAHQPNEYVELIDYYKSIELLYRFSREI